MADNFLEKQMDDYRRGAKTIVRQAKSSNSVFILGDDPAAVRYWVERFRSFGWRTAFAEPDTSRGRDLAQSTGSQHHPIELEQSAIERSMNLIISRWGQIDLIIIAGKGEAAPMIEKMAGVRQIPVLKS